MTDVRPAPAFDRRQELLRQAGVALHGRVVTLWHVTDRAEIVPEATSVASPPHHATNLDVDATLRRWGIPIIEGSRWVGCRLDREGRWCVAPVRFEPAAPPPGGVERRSPERIILELAGVGLGAVTRQAGDGGRAQVDALVDLGAHPGLIAHEVANPLTAALALLDGCLEDVRQAAGLPTELRAQLLGGLADVAEALERAVGFLRAVQDRARGALARRERFDAAHVVRSSFRLEQPLLKKRGVTLALEAALDPVFLNGDPNALFQVVTNLVRNAAEASTEGSTVTVRMSQAPKTLRLEVLDQGRGIPSELLQRVFDAGYTTKEFGKGSGMGLTVVRDVVQTMFGGSVRLDSTVGTGTTVSVSIPIPPQRFPAPEPA